MKPSEKAGIARKLAAFAAVFTAFAALFACFSDYAPSPESSGGALAAGAVKDSSSAWQGWRPDVSEGAKNAITNALYMYNTFWTPRKSISAWGTKVTTGRQFSEGHTYRGIPYGQPVHKGWYVGTAKPVPAFLEAVSDPESELYSERGENTWYYTDHGGPIWYSPFYSNDCSGFVSASYGTKRRTTREMGADPDVYQVLGTDITLASPGDLLNSPEGGHVIMILDMVYDREGGALRSVVTVEQTPPIILIRSFGKDGINGSLDDLRRKISDGGYSVVRYKYIEGVELTEGAGEAIPRTVNAVTEPASVMTADGVAEGVAYTDLSATSFRLEGWSLSEALVERFECSINGSAPVALTGSYYSELTRPVSGFPHLASSSGVNYYRGDISLSSVRNGDVAEVYSVGAGGERALCARLTLRQKDDFTYHLSTIESLSMTDGSDHVSRLSLPWSAGRPGTVTLNGWCVASRLLRFEIRVDDGLWYPVPNSFREDVYDYTLGGYRDCRDVNAFYCGVDLSSEDPYKKHTVSLRGVQSDGGCFTFAVVEYGARLNLPLVLGVAIPAAAAALFCAVFFPLRAAKKRKKA